MTNNEFITINTIEEYTNLLGCPPMCHPLFTICRLADVKDYTPIDRPVQLNLYSVTIKDGSTCNAKYGWRDYDFRNGSLNFYAPGQIHRWSDAAKNSGRWGWMLAFHPDFIRKHQLGTRIDNYKFFSYEVNEALHISETEKAVIENIMYNIEDEYHRCIDNHTQDIIVSQLDVLLNYSERFYVRQFRTRNCVESDVPARVLSIIRKRIGNKNGGAISVSGIAEEMNMSPHYLSDLLRNLTGMNTQQHIHACLIERAKILLVSTGLSVSEIAYELGFEYPQHFSRLFKSKTGITPAEYRRAM